VAFVSCALCFVGSAAGLDGDCAVDIEGARVNIPTNLFGQDAKCTETTSTSDPRSWCTRLGRRRERGSVAARLLRGVLGVTSESEIVQRPTLPLLQTDTSREIEIVFHMKRNGSAEIAATLKELPIKVTKVPRHARSRHQPWSSR
jgi:hypothetical protein